MYLLLLLQHNNDNNNNNNNNNNNGSTTTLTFLCPVEYISAEKHCSVRPIREILICKVFS